MKKVSDVIFSFGMFAFISTLGIVLLLGSIISEEKELRKQTQIRTEACYAQGMVLVRSDAGERCVLPQSLVKVK